MKIDPKGCPGLRRLIAIFAMVVAIPAVSRGGLSGPYTNDFYTLHLWHLQDTNGTVPFDATNGVFEFDYATNGLSVPMTMSNTPGVNAYGGPTNSEFSFAGKTGPGASFSATNYGYALSVMTTQHSCFFAPWFSVGTSIYPPPADTNLSNFANTNTGAFTFEALIQPDFDPFTFTADQDPQILCGDGPDSGANPHFFRSFQFRIKNATPSSGQA